LDELVDEPERARRLERRTLVAIALRAQTALVICALAMIDASAAPAVAVDEVLDVAAAARRLGLSKKTLQKYARRAPYAAFLLEDGTRRLRFSSARIEAWKHHEPAGSVTATPVDPPKRRKSGLSPGARPPHIGYELLKGRQGREDP
jgi:hypothetical protein